MLFDFTSLLNTIATLFLLLGVGFIAAKAKIVDEIGTKKLSDFVLKIGNPILIINAIIGINFSFENLKLGFFTLGAGILIHVLMAIIAFLIALRIKNQNERKITEFTMIFGNVGFIGLPILNSLFGAEGLFFGAFIVVGFNIFIWTWGISIIARGRADIKLTVKKAFINLGTVPSAIGFILFLMPFDLPEFAVSSLSSISSLCTPVSMLIIGALLAGRTVKQMLCEGKAYYLCLFKLLVIPMAVCLIMKLLGFGDNWVLFATAITAMPSATSVTMFAEIHDISQGYSAQCVGTTSLVSLATMPLVIYLANLVIAL